MKRIIIYWMIDLVLIAFLVICAIANRSQAEAQETFSPPSVGVGRTSVFSEKMHDVETEIQTEIESETAIETETEVETQLETEAVTEAEAEPETSYLQNEPIVVTTECVEVFPEANPIIETDIDALIVQVAGEYGLPWQLVRAVCWVESRIDPYAKSDHPDYGLMQVWSEVWKSYGYDPNSSTVYDPLTNLRVGCDVLKDKIDRSGGDWNFALTRYRFGDGDASARWANGDRTSWYAEEVLVKYYEYIREG